MFLQVACYKENKNSPLSCMTKGDTKEVLSALVTMMSSIFETLIKDLSEKEKKEKREAFYEEVIEALKSHEQDKKNFIVGGEF